MSEIKINYPVLGYAPGNYYCTCANCKSKFHGDKRAVQCELCALRIETSELRKQLEEKDKWISEANMLLEYCYNTLNVFKDNGETSQLDEDTIELIHKLLNPQQP